MATTDETITGATGTILDAEGARVTPRTTPKNLAEEQLLHYITVTHELRTRSGWVVPPGFVYAGMDDFLLRHGRFYDSQPLTVAEHDYVKRARDTYGRRLTKKQCFYNSQMLLLTAATWLDPVEGMDLRYVEGYGTGVIWVHHGWLTLNGKVIDTTLRVKGLPRKSVLPHRAVGTFPDTMAYFGVPFTTEAVRSSVLERHEGGSLLIDLKRQFPFLKRPYTVTP